MLLHDVGEDYWSISYYFFYCINLFPCERGLLVVFFLMHLWLDMGEDYLLILFFFASNLAPWWRWLLIDNGVVIPLMSTLWHDMGEDYWSTFFQLYSFLHDVKTIYRYCFLSRQTWLRGPHAAPTIEDYWPKFFYRVQLGSGRMHPSVHVRT